MNGGDGGGLAGVLFGGLLVSFFGHASCLLPDHIQGGPNVSYDNHPKLLHIGSQPLLPSPPSKDPGLSCIQ